MAPFYFGEIPMHTTKRAVLSRGPLVATLVTVGLLTDCRRTVPIRNGWFESYRDGVLTVSHEGRVYKAACDVSRSFNNASSISDPKNLVVFKSCDLPLALVGRTLQGFGGQQKDAEGNTVVMWDAGSTLALRSWRDEQTPWRLDEFKITSVSAKN